ncbi:CaiB/BaiF CoA transferase family protein [Hydrogenophaga palleronii]|uniref:CaiB/BaiF CoA transferase family protein n=1 Tax=Hydrogenophaga palleronii TaxID=65655 RepID=UPI000825DB17|nr:CaiB/BaiF CoA-transferase family protein [Hydrogenophaga palleronii]
MKQLAAHGPLHGVRVVEMAGLGPVSFTGMLLADMGAQVVRIARPRHADMEKGATLRSRTQITLDLHLPDEQQQALTLLEHADVLLEGFRPGVMERLGLGPDTLLARNPRLVYGRMTGWGQHGPRASTAGHDIDYIAITGALHAIGTQDPAVPLNLVGDYGGGALYLAMGVLAAVLHVRSGGAGQVVDCAICDGTVSLLSLMHGLRHAGLWRDARQSNTLDGAAPFYRTYRCSDGQHIAVGAIEPPFYRQLLERLGLSGSLFADQHDRAGWAEQARTLQAVFAQRTRNEWTELFTGTDGCVAPVNSLQESLYDPHLQSRTAFIEVAGEMQPAPVPRFAATPSRASPGHTSDARQVLHAWTIEPTLHRSR